MEVPRFDAKTALVIVDVQNDFAAREGSLYVRDSERVIARVNELIGAAQAANALVVYTKDWHPETTAHFQKDGGVWPVHCVKQSWGARFHPELIVNGPVVQKGSGGEDGYSGFSVRDPASGKTYATELERLLRERGVDRVIVVGLATDWCVKHTALDAERLGFSTTVVADATRAVNLAPDDGKKALSEMKRAGIEVV